MAKYVEFLKNMATFKKPKRIPRMRKYPPEHSEARRKMHVAKIEAELNKGKQLNENDHQFLMEMKTVNPKWVYKMLKIDKRNLQITEGIKMINVPIFFDEPYMRDHEYTVEELKILLDEEKKKRHTKRKLLEHYRKVNGLVWLQEESTGDDSSEYSP